MHNIVDMAKRQATTKIIGGDYKGTRLSFKPNKALRPTEGKTKETLFNWLLNDLDQKKCLDMFAGTGSLGLEAISRGAEKVVFIEKQKILSKSIESVIERLKIKQKCRVINANSMSFDFSTSNLFWGLIPGSIGETNKLLILLGAIFLIYCGIASWRIMVASVLGLISTAGLFNLLADYSTNAMLTITPLEHILIGSFLFGTVFMASEPVTSTHTNKGRWIYGFMIGVLTVIIRSINPAYPEGVMLAILIMNMFAPLIDYYVVKGNIKMRISRNA